MNVSSLAAIWNSKEACDILSKQDDFQEQKLFMEEAVFSKGHEII